MGLADVLNATVYKAEPIPQVLAVTNSPSFLYCDVDLIVILLSIPQSSITKISLSEISI